MGGGEGGEGEGKEMRGEGRKGEENTHISCAGACHTSEA